MTRLLVIAILGSAVGICAESGSCQSIPEGFSLAANAGRLNGFVPFPKSTFWNKDISTAPVDPRSQTWLKDMVFGLDTDLRILLLNSSEQNNAIGRIAGFVYHVVGGSQRRVNVILDTTGDSGGESSDPGPMPIPFKARIHHSLHAGDPYPDHSADGSGGTDAHIIVIDRDNCVLYELFSVTELPNGNIKAKVSVVFDLLGGDLQRPIGLTSGSVSGLPLFPGLVREEELAAGLIRHPLSISAFVSGGGNFFPHHSFVYPASHHQYGNGAYRKEEIPIGVRLRMKADVDLSKAPKQAQILGAAMKKYGLVLIDGGGTVDLYGAAAPSWDRATLNYFWENWMAGPKNMEVVETGQVFCDGMYVKSQGGGCPKAPESGPPPTINEFVASTRKSTAGQPVTLSWKVANVPTRLRFVTPEVGPVVTDSVVVTPQQTTTYTLMVQNQFGRTRANVKVQVGE
jgi:hypothetical protein